MNVKNYIKIGDIENVHNFDFNLYYKPELNIYFVK